MSASLGMCCHRNERLFANEMSERNEETIRCFLDKSHSDNNSVVETSTDDTTTTLSLPSLYVPNNETTDDRKNTNKSSIDGQKTWRLTIRDTERQLEELRRENFSLKLRIYCLEKNNSCGVSEVSDLAISQELLKREKTLRGLQSANDDQKRLIHDLQVRGRLLADDNNRLAAELSEYKDSLSRDRNEGHELSVELMTHLLRLCQLMRHSTTDNDTKDDTKRQQQLSRLEDLVNCASLLITKHEIGVKSVDTTRCGPEVVSEESEDDMWSEPDRDVARARIGLQCADKQLLTTTSGRKRSKALKVKQRINGQNDCQNTRESHTQTTSTSVVDVCHQSVQTLTTTTAKEMTSSLFTYFTTLSPMSRRSKQRDSNSVPKSRSSSLSSLDVHQHVDPNPSPDLGIDSETTDARVWMEARDWKRLQRCLRELKTVSTSDEHVLRALALMEGWVDGVNVHHWTVKGGEGRDRERLARLRRQISRQLAKTSAMVRKTENVLK